MVVTMNTKLTVFISAVTAEFGGLRDRIASVLRAKGHTVKVQSDFRQEGFADTTLSKLEGYIARCDRIIALIGNQSGSFPPAAAADPFNHMLPAKFERLSNTQWEVIFARDHNPKGLFVYDGRAYPTERPANGGDADQQVDWVTYLTKTLGLDRDTFTTADQALNHVLMLDWPDMSLGKPNNLPFGSRNELFIGREQALQDLRASLLTGTTAVTAQALHAMGGVGKTQLAVEYALRHAGSYSALLFISARILGAEDPQHSLRNALASLAETNALNLPNRKQVDEAAQSTLNWLGQNEGWLLIIDNVDTSKAAQAVQGLLGRLGKGHVLITARYGNWANVRVMPLDNMTPEHAVQLLLDTTAGKRRVKADDADVAADIARDLGFLALALRQAAAYVERNRITLADYRTRLQENRAKVLEWFNKDAMNYPEPVATTWAVTMAELSDNARDLLGMLSLYAPDPIPVSLLDPTGSEGEEVLAELADYAVITHDNHTPTFTMHPLLQEVTRQRLGDRKDGAMNAAIAALGAAIRGQNPQDVRTWPTLVPLDPHAAALVARIDATDRRDGLSTLLNQFGMLANGRADLSRAEAMFRRALAIDEASYGPDHPDVATDLNNLAGVLRDTNRLPEAAVMFRRALAIDEASYGTDHPEVATDLNNLAGVLQATNRLPEAEAMYRRALAITEASYGPDHPTVSTGLNNLAGVLQATNRLPEAEAMYRRALAITEASYGTDQPTVATGLNNLAGVLKATNRLPEAEAMFRRALAITEASYGTDHPAVANRLSNLAVVLQATNRLPEAEAMFRRALAIDEASYGPDHPLVANRLSNLAVVLQATNRLPEAEAMFRRALAIDEASYGPDHPEVATRLNNLAVVLKATNRLPEAEAMFRRALAIDEASYGTDHPEVATDLNNLAGVLQATNRLPEAEAMFRRALAITEASYGPDHTEVATGLNNLAGVLEATNRLPEAEAMFRRALAITEASYGPDHTEVATGLNNLAGVLEATNRLPEAEAMFRRALAILLMFGQVTQNTHPKLQRALGNWAGAMEGLRKSEAEVIAALQALLAEVAAKAGAR
jgi:tetratricopeptide (TPR) repeat protein